MEKGKLTKNRKNEIDSRKQNIIWTVAGKYDFYPYLFLDEEQFEEINETELNKAEFGNREMYLYMLMGYVNRNFRLNRLAGFLYNITANTEHAEAFYKVAELVLDRCFHEKLSSQRSSFGYYREKYIDERLEYYRNILDSKEKNKNSAEYNPNLLSDDENRVYRDIDLDTETMEIEYLYYIIQKGGYSCSRKVIEDIVKKICSIECISDFEGIKEFLSSVFYKYFYINRAVDRNAPVKVYNEKRNSEKIRKQKLKKMNLSEKFRIKDDDELEKNSVFSADFADVNIMDSFEDEKVIQKEDTKAFEPSDSDDPVFGIIRESYGTFDRRYSSVMRNNDLICSGVHEGCSIYFSSMVYPDTPNGRYFKSLMKEQREKNLEHFEFNSWKYRREIIKLKSEVEKGVLRDMDYEMRKTSSGKLRAGRVWKAEILEKNNIFEKSIKDETGRISIDIFLDASASQEGRQEKIAAQAFIIAQAMTELNLPVRVASFRSLFHFTVFSVYREYNESKSANTKIFNYFSSGSNRDGLAYKSLRELVVKNQYENRVVIVLSDANPNNSAKSNFSSLGKNNIIPYKGEAALMDSAKEIFRYKLDGTIVLGVYTGNDENLENEKYIFGNDFVHIKDISRFSKVVGDFIKTKIIGG